MLKNYFKIAIRNLLKSKIYSLINIFGLATGIAGCLLILLFVTNEVTYDDFHENSQNIYRVNLKFHLGTNQFDVAEASFPAGPGMLAEFPEVRNMTRIYRDTRHGESMSVKYEDLEFREDKFYFADSTFGDLFSVKTIAGNLHRALGRPNSLAISEKMTEKYFSGENPIGKMLKTNDGKSYEVRAVFADFPQNSHFHFDFLASLVTVENEREWEWVGIDAYTYLLLDEQANWLELNDKLKEFSRAKMGPMVQAEMGVGWDDFLAAGNELGFFLQPLKSIHLTQGIQNEFEPNGDLNTIYIFTAIALIILLIACVNFINLATARSTQRATEVGIRKVVGSAKSQLIGQFLIESILLSYISLVIAFLLVELTLPLFNGIIGKQLSTGTFSLYFYLGAFLLGGVIIGGLAGIYPAFAISSFNIIAVLKGKLHASQGNRFRNALVIFQFTISIVLFVGTMVIYQQLNYVRGKDLGFNKEHVMVVSNAAKLGQNQKAFKQQLKQMPSVMNASFSGSLPQMNLEARVYAKPEESGKTYTLVVFQADDEFMETYQLRLSGGRYFSPERGQDSNAVILNKAALAALNITDLENTRLITVGEANRQLKIIGVFEDFHVETLHQPIRPCGAVLMPENGVESMLSVRIRPGQISETVKALEKKWKQFLPDQPFEYTFYDEHFDENYRAEIQSGKVFSAFAILAIIIACLGMLGLASFMVTQRTKEIGIRKVLGASIPNLIYMLFRDLLRWVLAANIFAWPLAWFAMRGWLNNFAYRTEIGWWIFLVAAFLALLIAVGTVSFQAFRAAIANPVRSLKYE